MNGARRPSFLHGSACHAVVSCFLLPFSSLLSCRVLAACEALVGSRRLYCVLTYEMCGWSHRGVCYLCVGMRFYSIWVCM